MMFILIILVICGWIEGWGLEEVYVVFYMKRKFYYCIIFKMDVFVGENFEWFCYIWLELFIRNVVIVVNRFRYIFSVEKYNLNMLLLLVLRKGFKYFYWKCLILCVYLYKFYVVMEVIFDFLVKI